MNLTSLVRASFPIGGYQIRRTATRGKRYCAAIVGLLAVEALSLGAADTQSGDVPRFESDILPIFKRHCLACHGDEQVQAGLNLGIREGILKGGQGGPAIKPGSAASSLLFQKVSSGQMPLGGEELSEQQLAVIRHWIDGGALKNGEGAEPASRRVAVAQTTESEVMATILHMKCLVCHGKQVQQGGLNVLTRDALLRGGESGPAILLGAPDKSLLVRRIVESHPSPDLQNEYFVRPVTSDELDKLRSWIAAGAPPEMDEALTATDGAGPLITPEDRKFWSFQPPKSQPIPKVQNQSLVRSPIDAFLLEKLEAKGLVFSPEADRLTLMRRAYFDLIGLPPTAEEVAAYLRDQHPDAYERLVDRLLESCHYGERWGQHWLDAVGYADSEGGGGDSVRTEAYRYRDYVIRSLNADKPYDRFLIEQIAGDELFDYKATANPTPEQIDNLIATGFLRMTPDRTHEHDANFVPTRMETVADVVEMVSSNVLGLTMGCTRCHNHKFDPISQRDYYRFSAILNAAYDPYDWLIPNKLVGGNQKRKPAQRFLEFAFEQERKAVLVHNEPLLAEIADLERSLEGIARPLREKLLEKKLAQLPNSVRSDLREALGISEEDRNPVQRYLVERFKSLTGVIQKELEDYSAEFKEHAQTLKKRIEDLHNRLRPEPRIRALFDMGGEPVRTRILLRGDPFTPGVQVEPGVPSVLSDGLVPYRVVKPEWSTGTTGRRLALARWLVEPNHPLTSRVFVNRLWQHHFGRGLVTTPGNFGRMGARPSHSELLDWLAVEFVRQGWSIKTTHRLIMKSTAYRQRSKSDPERQKADPDNQLLSRFAMQRMDAEVIRDSILRVAGRLDTTPFGPPEALEVTSEGEVVNKSLPFYCAGGVCVVPARQSAHRRSIYVLRRRETPLTILEVFDSPSLLPNCLQRISSTGSIQALQLMNGEMIRENARYLAGRAIDASGADRGKQVRQVYLAALSRPPTTHETEKGAEAIRRLTAEWLKHLETEPPAEPKQSRAEWLGLASFCLAVLNSPNFLYID